MSLALPNEAAKLNWRIGEGSHDWVLKKVMSVEATKMQNLF